MIPPIRYRAHVDAVFQNRKQAQYGLLLCDRRQLDPHLRGPFGLSGLYERLSRQPIRAGTFHL
jgi:hypothetical protein